MERINALYVGNGRKDCSFVNEFIEHCKKVALQNVQIAMDFIGLPAIYAKKRAGFNVLFVDFDVIAEDLEKAKKAMEKFAEKIPLMPVFVLFSKENDILQALDDFGDFCGRCIFCERGASFEAIFHEIEASFS